MRFAANSLSSIFSSSWVSSATLLCRDTCPSLNPTRSYSPVGDGALIGDAGTSIDHPLSTSSFHKILAEFGLSTTKPFSLLTITPSSSLEDTEGPLSDGQKAVASDLSATATAICADNASGKNLTVINLPVAVALSFEPPLLPSPFSGGDDCSFTAVQPASPIAIVGLGADDVAEDLLLPACSAVADVLRTCVAQVVQNLCVHVPLQQERVLILATVHADADLPEQRIDDVIDNYVDRLLDEAGHDVALSATVRSPEALRAISREPGAAVDAKHARPPGTAAALGAARPVIGCAERSSVLRLAFLRHATDQARLRLSSL